MVHEAVHLSFDEKELSDKKVKKAYDRATRNAAKADKAVKKINPRKYHDKLRNETAASANRKEALRFGKAEKSVEIKKPTQRTKQLIYSSVNSTIRQVNKCTVQGENSTADSISQETLSSSKSAGSAVSHSIYANKARKYSRAEHLTKKSDRSNVDALYSLKQKNSPNSNYNPISKLQQKRAIKKEYAAAFRGKGSSRAGTATAKQAQKAVKEAKNAANHALNFVVANHKVILISLLIGAVIMIFSALFSSCSAIFGGTSQTVAASSYTAADDDIINTNEDYKTLEASIRTEIDSIESTHSGYDEYRYTLEEIGHNPYELASYLTVIYEEYTRDQVQDTLTTLIDGQYEITLTEETETRTRTETKTGTREKIDPETGETVLDEETGEPVMEEYEYEEDVEYEYRILNISLENNGLNFVVGNSGLTEEQMQRYSVLLQTKGNKPELFSDDIYATSGEGIDYDIPGEALTDVKFANMMKEAEKYLGYPYVWGGSSPSTSFDCSGYVSWVINHCNNGWNVGRLGAGGLKNCCDIIPKESAKPGDLIFFERTYDETGATHVGIYVGDGMMLHCGNPISYTSIEYEYWVEHFLCFGRIRD